MLKSARSGVEIRQADSRRHVQTAVSLMPCLFFPGDIAQRQFTVFLMPSY